jgi:Ser/Thr protein kinase RdoA (MazF antagonist)/catechol 2,3-dioxygenase-like lactoylglutathione lyase family enzyme
MPCISNSIFNETGGSMLTLKHLIDNRPLTLMILGNWNFDEDSLDLLDEYRISSNATYPFYCNGEVELLRYAPVSEKSEDNLAAELEFLRYLDMQGYPALRIIPSRSQMDFEKVETPWGQYVACVFARVPGESMDTVRLTEDIVMTYGRTLGQLHNRSSSYTPEHKRWSYTDVFAWIRNTLLSIEEEDLALSEADFLEKIMDAVPKSPETYGLIHYDFELDNVFYDEDTATCHVIDFDDAMFHFYGVDVEKALASIREKASDKEYDIARGWFLAGYRSVRAFSDETLELFPLYRRFISLYGYARIVRAIHEPVESEPEWMRDLRDHLLFLLGERSSEFGEPLFGMAMKTSSSAAESAPDVPEWKLLIESHCVFPVPDLVKTAGYYEDALRFKSVHWMDAAEPHICLYRDGIEIILTQANSSRVFPHRELYGYGYDAYFITREQDLLEAELIAAGVKIVRELSKTDYHNREFVFEDIDGRWIGIGCKE